MTYSLAEWDPDSPDEFDGWYIDHTGVLIARRLDTFSSPRLLEIGCATGRMTQFLWSSAQPTLRRILAVDQSAAMIERARAERPIPGVAWQCGDVLGLRSMEFDAIVCCSVLHEVPEVRAMVRKCRELLAPGGRVFVTVPNAGSIHYQPGVRSEREDRFGVRARFGIGSWHTALITGTGLRVVDRFEFMLKPYPNARMARLPAESLDFLAGYRGPGGALCFFELEAV